MLKNLLVCAIDGVDENLSQIRVRIGRETDLIIELHSENHEVTSCYLCQITKQQTGCKPPKLEDLEVTADYTFDKCMADLTWLPNSGGYEGLFVIIDLASRKSFCAPVKNKKSRTIIDVFKETFIPKFNGRNIENFRCENGTEFASKEFRDFCNSMNIKLTFGNPNISKPGGKVERMNQTIQQKIRLEMEKKCLINWIKLYREVVENYNNSPHSGIRNYAPNNMFIKLINDYDNKIPITVNKAKEILSNLPGFPYFKVHNWVLKKVINIGRKTEYKLQPMFEGPYKIIKEYERRKSYILKDLNEPPQWLLKNNYFQLKMWDKIPKYYTDESDIKYNQHYYKYNNDFSIEENSSNESEYKSYHGDYSFSPNSVNNSVIKSPEMIPLRNGRTMKKPDKNSSTIDHLIWNREQLPDYSDYDVSFSDGETGYDFNCLFQLINKKYNHNSVKKEEKQIVDIPKLVVKLSPIKYAILHNSVDNVDINIEINEDELMTPVLSNNGIDSNLIDSNLYNINTLKHLLSGKNYLQWLNYML
ncbi:unnamed protein product [Rotaria socialis]|uniref:Integrase catalytic domain-containing protein n=1 Tax=Rotaria socialis TaxID=392032 RepID=A0A821QUR6_9BILA|nr:unnamed protein product [Rotaria socialis]CAF4830916.1 unnamed protein product [Rotaria socialis]